MTKCELCDSLANMYCKSDQANLCWDCDSNVHGANFLVAKHSRTLLCHICQSFTPWTASGPKLSPTVSVCENCVNNSTCREERNNGDDQSSDGDDLDRKDDEDKEEENQVVPLSSRAPPPQASSSSNSDRDSDEGASRSIKTAFPMKQMRETSAGEASQAIKRAEKKHATSWKSGKLKQKASENANDIFVENNIIER